jgi:hypothetical protein
MTRQVASTDQTKPKAAKQNRRIGIAMLPRGWSFIYGGECKIEIDRGS